MHHINPSGTTNGGSAKWILLSVLLGGAGVIAAFCLLNSDNTSGESRLEALAHQPDSQLVGSLAKQRGDPKKDDWEFRLVSFQEDGVTPKVAKAFLRRREYPATVPTIRYEYFGANGRKERSWTIHPRTVFGSSCFHKFKEELYGDDGETVVETRYIRENRLLAAKAERLGEHSRCYTHYRSDDGLTARRIQVETSETTTLTELRPDGKTPWWVFDYGKKEWTCHVFFDLEGKPLDKTFRYESLCGNGFSMGSGSPPLANMAHNWLRSDGTVECRQEWYHVYDKSDGEFKDMLKFVTVCDTHGKPQVTYELALRGPDLPLFIVQATTFNADGTKLVRRYSAPNTRVNEEVLDSQGKTVSFREFKASETYEKLDLPTYFFQGFHVSLRGMYAEDDPSYDR